MLIDSHCHINDPVYIADPAKYVEESFNNGVKTLVVIGFDLKSSLDAIKIAEQFDNVYATVGIIPAEVKNMGQNDLKEIEKLLNNKKVIAIGEIGLDFYWDKDEKLKEDQKKIFIKQIELANKYNLPVSIHSRDASEATFLILKNHKVNRCGVIHCYSGSPEMAKEYTRLGYLLGIGGVVTFKNSIALKEVTKIVDKDKYVLETDAPYLTPVPHRGELNHSKYLSYIRDEVALLRGVDPSVIEEETNENFARVFLR